MEVLFATTNMAKVKKYKEELKKYNIDLLTINDIDINIGKVKETGKNAIENAYIKAKAYYDKLNMPTIGMDNNLFIEGLPKDKQPGIYVRRIKGKELNDDEMIKYYTDLVKQNGGKLNARWVYGMVVLNNGKENTYTWKKENFNFIDKPSTKRNPGYPLDSITIIPEFNKYLVELNEAEKNKYKKNDNTNEVVKFIVKSLKD